ncbi:MAG: hypothetical protein IKF52_06195 [Clostridia bacterium]|nr:hypothetical protein [Clostridia bacterium]
MIDLTNPVLIFPILGIVLASVYVAKKIKNPYVVLTILVLNIGLLLSHFLKIGSDGIDEQKVFFSIALDLSLLLISFIAYLWVDNIKSKESGAKTLNDGISWFWDKI